MPKKKKSKIFNFLLFFTISAIVFFITYNLSARQVGIIDKYNVDYKIIDYASGKYIVNPEIAINGSEKFDNIINRLKPLSAITGTFYDAERKPLGDILSNGKIINRGNQRQAIAFTANGKIFFLERKPNTKIDWTGYKSGIACGPRLVRSGQKSIDVKKDGFSQSAETKTAWRCAIGATKDNKLILCAVSDSITLDILADIMLELGACNAINLDGGSMAGFYSDGEIKVQPVQSINNVIAVYKK
ncbi:MAG: phosphodiester glycosidase family protein [Armatimonadota bacterium]